MIAQTLTQTVQVLENRPIEVTSSRIFTYPTRLISAWQPEIMEVNMPAYQLKRPPVEISVYEGITRPLNIQSRKKLFAKLSAPLQVREGYLFDARFDTDKNIAHVLTNILPAVIAARTVLPDITVILSADASGMAKEIFRLLNFPVLCTNQEVQGQLVVATSAANGNYEGLYNQLFGETTFEGFNPKTPERVFIARKGPRRLINEDEVEQCLRQYGFQKFYFEDISISEQWSLMKNAEAVVALHGAALANLIFNARQVKLLELFHPGYVVNMYRHLAHAVNGSWCGVTGQLPEDIIKNLEIKQDARSFALKPTLISVDALKMGLDYLKI